MKKTFKDYIIVLFGSSFTRGIAFLNTILLARWLRPEEFGKFSLFYFLMILTWQLPQAFDMTYVRYAKTSNSDREKNDFLKTAIFFKLSFVICILILATPLSYLLAQYCFQKAEVQPLLVFAFITGGFLSFLMTIASIFQEKGQFTKYTFLYAFYTISVLIAVVVLHLGGYQFNLVNVILIYTGVSVVIGFVSMRILFKKVGALFDIHKNVLAQSLSLGKWIFGSTCVYFIFQRLDVLFLTRFVDFHSLGIYSVAAQMLMFLSLITGSLSGVFLPKASSALTSKEALRLYVKESLIAVGVINMLVIIIMIAAPFLINILFGPTYSSAAPLFRILLWGWFFLIIYLPFSFLFFTLNDSKTGFMCELVKLFLGLGLLIYLVPVAGPKGAAVAISAALIMSSITAMVVLGQKIKLKFARS